MIVVALCIYLIPKEDKEYGYINCKFNTKKPNAIVCVDIDVEKMKKIIYGNLFNYN